MLSCTNAGHTLDPPAPFADPRRICRQNAGGRSTCCKLSFATRALALPTSQLDDDSTANGILPTPKTSPPDPVSYYSRDHIAADATFTSQRRGAISGFQTGRDAPLRMFTLRRGSKPDQRLSGCLCHLQRQRPAGEPNSRSIRRRAVANFVHAYDVRAPETQPRLTQPATRQVLNRGTGRDPPASISCRFCAALVGHTPPTYPLEAHRRSPAINAPLGILHHTSGDVLGLEPQGRNRNRISHGCRGTTSGHFG